MAYSNVIQLESSPVSQLVSEPLLFTVVACILQRLWPTRTTLNAPFQFLDSAMQCLSTDICFTRAECASPSEESA